MDSGTKVDPVVQRGPSDGTKSVVGGQFDHVSEVDWFLGKALALLEAQYGSNSLPSEIKDDINVRAANLCEASYSIPENEIKAQQTQLLPLTMQKFHKLISPSETSSSDTSSRRTSPSQISSKETSPSNAPSQGRLAGKLKAVYTHGFNNIYTKIKPMTDVEIERLAKMLIEDEEQLSEKIGNLKAEVQKKFPTAQKKICDASALWGHLNYSLRPLKEELIKSLPYTGHSPDHIEPTIKALFRWDHKTSRKEIFDHLCALTHEDVIALLADNGFKKKLEATLSYVEAIGVKEVIGFRITLALACTSELPNRQTVKELAFVHEQLTKPRKTKAQTTDQNVSSAPDDKKAARTAHKKRCSVLKIYSHHLVREMAGPIDTVKLLIFIAFVMSPRNLRLGSTLIKDENGHKYDPTTQPSCGLKILNKRPKLVYSEYNIPHGQFLSLTREGKGLIAAFHNRSTYNTSPSSKQPDSKSMKRLQAAPNVSPPPRVSPPSFGNSALNVDPNSTNTFMPPVIHNKRQKTGCPPCHPAASTRAMTVEPQHDNTVPDRETGTTQPANSHTPTLSRR